MLKIITVIIVKDHLKQININKYIHIIFNINLDMKFKFGTRNSPLRLISLDAGLINLGYHT